MRKRRGVEISLRATIPQTTIGTLRRGLRRLYESWLRELWPRETSDAHYGPDLDLGCRADATGHLCLASRKGHPPCGALVVGEPGKNGRVSPVWLYVEPRWRMRNVGRSLLRRAVHFLDRAGIAEIRTSTTSTLPSGEELTRRLGASVILSRQIYEGSVGALNLGLLRHRSECFRHPDVTLEVHVGRYPPTDLAQLAALRASIYHTYGLGINNEAARQALIELDFVIHQRRLIRLGVLARDPHDAVVGIVETIWNPASPAVLTDWFEAVAPSRRGRRLGASLTATLLLEVVARLPAVRAVSIGMHESAKSLHARVEEIGFCFRHRETQWRASSDLIREYVHRDLG